MSFIKAILKNGLNVQQQHGIEFLHNIEWPIDHAWAGTEIKQIRVSNICNALSSLSIIDDFLKF